MIIVRLQGGLGNQLFQYAAARALSVKHAAELVLDTNWFDVRRSNVTPRKLEITSYLIDARLMNSTEARQTKFYRSRFFNVLPTVKPWIRINEKAFQNNRFSIDLPDDVYLDGFWQSDRYFSSIKALLYKEIIPRAVDSFEETDISRMIASTNSVSVHVRRGDYVTNPSTAQYHGTCSLSYYSSSVKHILKSVKDPYFFVFSDDIVWAKSNLHFDAPTFYVEHGGSDAAIRDLYLMARCKHQIIANSSFSWWGAWLNKNTSKIVIAPQQWFSNNAINSKTKDLLPDDWIQINS